MKPFQAMRLRKSAAAVAAVITTQPWTAASSATTHAVTLPAGIAAGDLLLIQFVGRPGNTGAVSTPAGWTLLAQNAQTTNQQATWFWKIASGSEGASVTVTIASATNTCTAHTYKVPAASWNSASAPEVASASAAGTVVMPTVTPSWGAGNVLCLAAIGVRSDASITGYPLANGQTLTPGAAGGSGGTGNRADVASCWAAMAGSSFSPGSFSQSGTRGTVGHTVVIRAP